jgi:Tfp pilus assembly protein PilF
MEKLNPEGYELGKKYLDQAIALDPEYAEPHTALGEYYYYLAMGNLRASKEAMPLARAAATRALELDPSNAEAHAVLCFVAAFYDYDWTEAEKQHRLTTAGPAQHGLARLRRCICSHWAARRRACGRLKPRLLRIR